MKYFRPLKIREKGIGAQSVSKKHGQLLDRGKKKIKQETKSKSKK